MINLPSGFPTNTVYAFFTFTMLDTYSVHIFLQEFISLVNILVKSKSYEVPIYPPSLVLLVGANIIFTTSFSDTLN